MFKVGDTVLYGADGVCKIVEITEKSFGEISTTYYVLAPIFTNGSTFFVPTQNEKLASKMHEVLSLEEIKSIIDKSGTLTWQENDMIRKDEFKAITSGGDFGQVVSLLKTIIAHKKEVEALGKNLHKADEIAYKEAIKIIYEEFNMSMEISKEDVLKIVVGV